MTYKPFLISNYATGLDRELQPWLLPTDAYVDLEDGFVHRGVTRKRHGYSGFANGTESTYCESRMVVNVAGAAMTGAIDSANTTYTLTASTPVRRGTFTVTGTTPAQTATDDGEGGFTGDVSAGTIDYTTGDVSITFDAAPTAGTVTATYDYHQGFPVMGIMNFYTSANVRQLLVADTTYVNIYNPATDRLDDISSGTAYNGTAQDFWSWVNYETSASVARLLFCNGVVGDVIQQYTTAGGIAAYAPTFTTGTLNARQMFNVRDRLVLFQTIEAGTLYPRRIRISGTGANVDNFDDTAGGAGFIDIPDNTWFYGAAFNRDDILFFTEAATWMLKYTGNDINPFALEKIDGSRGSSAAFSVISYLNRTIAASPRGLIISDGYKVERMDESIPDFVFNSMNPSQDAFESVYSGFFDEDRTVYMLYPSQGDVRPALVAANSSDRILTINFDEDNYSVYKIPLSTVGNFQLSLTVTWADLTAANGVGDWDVLAEKYNNWNAFPFSKGAPISIGGGHKGEIWRMTDTQSEDNPQKIRALSVVDADTVRVTTDWNNYNIGDNIVLEDVEGMTEINHMQGAIKAISTDYVTFDVEMTTLGFSTYTGGGIASKTVDFVALTKKFNPFTEADKKVRCGWVYFYVSVANTLLKDADGDDIPAFLDIDVITNDNEINSSPPISYRVDCSNLEGEIGQKQWVKIWINQTARFIQFRMRNNQAGADIRVHAMMPGFQPLGRIV